MKTSELMQGDILDYFSFPVVVVSVGKSVLTKDYDGKNTYLVKADALKPIPLTEKILEKNFEPFVFEGKTYYEHNTDFEDMSISEYNEGLWAVTVDEIEFSGMPTWKMYVCDVHQLQHALKSCGINKEIEI